VDVVLVPARLEDAFVLATTMREKDVAELAACGMTPLEGVLLPLKLSEQAWTALYDDVVGCMFGVVIKGEGLGRTAYLWSLTSHLFGQKPKAFYRAARHAVPVLLEQYNTLSNLIDARYTEAQRFVQALGGQLGEPQPVAPYGATFIPFTFRRTSWAA
jgi:hypothetical protein